MTSRTLSLTISCPEWCDESPLQHLEGVGSGLAHTHSMGKIGTTLRQDVRVDDIVTAVEVTLERFDYIAEDGVHVGQVGIRLGGDEVYPVETARDLAALLLDTADVFDEESPRGDSATQVLAEQDAVAEQ